MKQAFDVVHAMRPGLLQLQSLPPLSLYVHLPWCIQKCPYCDFNSHEWRDNSQAMPEQRYIDALLADLEISLPLVWGRPVHWRGHTQFVHTKQHRSIDQWHQGPIAFGSRS